jgi:hypothetical protein
MCWVNTVDGRRQLGGPGALICTRAGMAETSVELRVTSKGGVADHPAAR